MANLNSERRAIHIPAEDEDTIPDSFSLTDYSIVDRPVIPLIRPNYINDEDEVQSPSDWRLDIRQVGRPSRHWACPFFYIPILYGYAFFGAWMFTTIERGENEPEETLTTCDVNQNRNITHMFYEGLPYSISVFTTVGYGVQAPKTKEGKLATIFYALFGIPLYFAFSADFQDWIDQTIFVWIYSLIIRVQNKFRIVKVAVTPVPKIARWKKFLWILGITISWLFFQGWITMLVENSGGCDHWTYMDAIYFVIQSAALIGFGDMMARRNLYIYVHLPMLTIGQVLLTGLFTAAIKYIRYRLPRWICKCVNGIRQKCQCKKKKTTTAAVKAPIKQQKKQQKKKKTNTVQRKATAMVNKEEAINNILKEPPKPIATYYTPKDSLIEHKEEIKEMETEKSTDSTKSEKWV